MRTNVLCAGPILVGSAVGLRAEEWTKTYPVTGKPEVRVRCDNGGIRVSMG